MLSDGGNRLIINIERMRAPPTSTTLNADQTAATSAVK
jgi:hypothetical protein